MSFVRFLPLALVALAQSLAAQQLPSAGGQLQQIPAPPAAPRPAPTISIVPQGTAAAGAAADGQRITVNALRISGASAYRDSDLVALTGFRPGSALTLDELRAMAARITERYRSDGYFVAQAYLPAQDIAEGVVTIAVLEGRYGQVVVRNRSRLADGIAESRLAGIDSGAAITIAPLEHRLLLLSDIPGVAVSSTLAPGARLGESDLVVDVAPAPLVSGSVDADNAGNRYTGAYRVGATVNLNNAAGRGDVATVRALTSGSGLTYGRVSYQMLFGKATGGIAYSALHYRLGREFEPLQASGSAGIASVYGSYPLQRSRTTNLTAQLELDAKTFRDRVDSVATVVDKKALASTATLRGDHLDGLGGGGFNTYWLAATLGSIDIRTPSSRAQDEATARSNGGYGKLAFGAARLQRVNETLSLYAAVSGQVASKNLDVSEKMELGGVNAVRAYPEGEAYADEGVLLTLEARLALSALSRRLPAQLQLVGFVDTGSVRVDHSPWAAGDNSRTLSGAGIGLNAATDDGFVVRVSYAHRLGSQAARSAPDSAGRFWVQLVKYF